MWMMLVGGFGDVRICSGGLGVWRFLFLSLPGGG